jgi:hypothetical protein
VSFRDRFRRRPLVPFMPEELSRAAAQLWPGREEMPTPGSVANIIAATRADPALRLEMVSWLRRTAVPRGQELHSFVGMLIAIVTLGFAATVVNAVVAIGLTVLALIGLFWLVALSTNALIELSERSSHATAWLGAVEDAIAVEARQRHPWWRRR